MKPSIKNAENIEKTVLRATGAKAINNTAIIQSLWSGYGEIVRLTLEGCAYPSVILKHVMLPDEANHPRGWNTGLSHQRKIRSYQVEANWYQYYAQQCDSSCPVPRCLAVEMSKTETVLVLTDLDASGYVLRKGSSDLNPANLNDIKACLDWLANFHAIFMGSSSEGLWECGSYWHLDTRPDELAALDDHRLQEAAPLIDQQLKQCKYQTLIHGDAKLANFCFTNDVPTPAIAAVDFQYIGQGCGIKDVAYFIGSCVAEEDCEALENTLLDHYFLRLSQAIRTKQSHLDIVEIEAEWRGLYDVAWADFHRFLKGWSPGHWKLNSYSERLTKHVIERLQS